MNIVAEIGTSHGGNFEKACALIDAASDSGADTVKFQWVYADEILHPDTGFVSLPGGNIRLYDRFRSLEVDSDFFSRCRDYAHKKGLMFACSPFGLRSLKELCEIQPDAIKIASPEVNHIPLLKETASYIEKIPVILSGGVSKLGDLERAIDILTEKSSSLTLLHCVTFYPAPETEYNVRTISSLSKVFGLPCGISDHSLDPVLVPVLSAMCGGSMIEKHITLSRETDGLDDPVALEPEQFAQMVTAVHNACALLKRYERDALASGFSRTTLLENGMQVSEGQKNIFDQMALQYGKEKVLACLGDGIKKLSPSEKENYGRTNRSLHFMHGMKAGEKISEKDISVLRTEKVLTPGISPEFLEECLGSVLSRDVSAGEGVTWEALLKRD